MPGWHCTWRSCLCYTRDHVGHGRDVDVPVSGHGIQITGCEACGHVLGTVEGTVSFRVGSGARPRGTRQGQSTQF